MSYSFEISEEAAQRIGDLILISDATSTGELVHNALAVYDIVLHHQNDGGIVILHKDGEADKQLISVPSG